MNSEYSASSMFTSLDTSFPDLSGFVQYIPLALWPLTESGSPGFLVKQIAANGGYLEPQYFQDMGVVELTEVDKSSDKDGTIHNWDCIIKTAEVPRIVDLNRNRGIAFIGLIDKQTPITITTPNVVGFAKYKKFTNKM